MTTASLNDYKVPTTTLQAVNIVLEAMGERTISSLDAGGVPASTAIQRLGEVNVELQEEGWSFNTDDAFAIDPATDGSITLPNNTLKVRQAYFDGGYDKKLVVRGKKLYDRKNSTFNIAVPVKVDLTVALDFEDLPQAARWYITARAARRAATGKLVSATVYQFTKADEDVARLRLEQAEAEATAMETLAGNPHVSFMRYR